MLSLASQQITPRTLSCLGLNWQTEVSLRGTMSLLKGMTQEEWVYTAEPNADAVVYAPGDALAQAMARRSANDARKQVFICAGGDESEDFAIKFPLGASRLVACLNRVSSRLAGVVTTVGHRGSASLCQRLDDAIRTHEAVAISLRADGDTGVFDLAERELYWPRALTLDELAHLLAAEVDIKAIAAADADLVLKLKAGAANRVCGETFLWGVGAARSKGLLLQRIHPDHKYRLRRWPNFGVVGHRGVELRCASLLMQRAMTPRELASVSTMPLSVVSSFLNASAISGLLEEQAVSGASNESGDTAPVHSKLGGVLSKIRKVFALA